MKHEDMMKNLKETVKAGYQPQRIDPGPRVDLQMPVNIDLNEGYSDEPLFSYANFTYQGLPNPIHYTATGTTERAERHKMVKDLLLEQWSISSTLLDVGCGNGEFISDWRWTYFFNEEHFEIPCCYGLDIEKRSRMICPDRLSIAKAEHLPCKDQSFDLITAICIIEHLESPIQFLREVYRVCRKGIVVVTPNLARPSRWWGKANDLEGHYQGYDIPLLTQVIESVGFKVEKVEVRFVDCPGFKWWPRLAKWLSYRWLKKLFPQLGSEIYVLATKT